MASANASDNNGGTAYSGSAPTSESTSPFAAGGYVLQYMYSLTSSEVEKYLTTDFMPVSTDSAVSTAAVDGTISSLNITAGSGYTDGTYYTAVYGDGTDQGTSDGAVIRNQTQDSDIYFSKMKNLNDNIKLNELSMGMSHDYLSAVKYSSSYLRIGSKIFGARS